MSASRAPITFDASRSATALEPRWPASVAAVAIAALHLVLPERFSVGPTFVFPCLVLLLVIPLTLKSPNRRPGESRALRLVAFGLIALIAAGNGVALWLLVRDLLASDPTIAGRQLLGAALIVWLVNIAVFGIWFWELDRGGPHERAAGTATTPDFLFPQMGDPRAPDTGWRPTFLDFLYVAYTNASAYSPTDTMPLSRRAKVLMAVHSLTSLVTLVLVTARAVNVLR